MKKKKYIPQTKKPGGGVKPPEVKQDLAEEPSNNPKVRDAYIAAWVCKSRQEKRQATCVIHGSKMLYLDYLRRVAKGLPAITNTETNQLINHKDILFESFYKIGQYALVDHMAMIKAVTEYSVKVLNQAKDLLIDAQQKKAKSKKGTPGAAKKPAPKKAAAKKSVASKKNVGARIVQLDPKTPADKQQKKGKRK